MPIIGVERVVIFLIASSNEIIRFFANIFSNDYMKGVLASRIKENPCKINFDINPLLKSAVVLELKWTGLL